MVKPGNSELDTHKVKPSRRKGKTARKSLVLRVGSKRTKDDRSKAGSG